VRDRDRDLLADLNRINNEMSARGHVHSGARLNQLAHAKQAALQEYRDEASRKRRAFRDALDHEGWFARRWRRRNNRPRPEMWLPLDCLAMVARWRQDVMTETDRGRVDDPTAEVLEPELRAWEVESAQAARRAEEDRSR
jgi:hypothetical protein